MARQAIDYDEMEHNLFNYQMTAKIDGFTFEPRFTVRNNLDRIYQVSHIINGSEKLIDTVNIYDKTSISSDIQFKSFKDYMKWLRTQVKAKNFLYI